MRPFRCVYSLLAATAGAAVVTVAVCYLLPYRWKICACCSDVNARSWPGRSFNTGRRSASSLHGELFPYVHCVPVIRMCNVCLLLACAMRAYREYVCVPLVLLVCAIHSWR